MQDQMERAQLGGDQECDGFIRKDTFQIEMRCRAICPDKKEIFLALDYGRVAVRERHCCKF